MRRAARALCSCAAFVASAACSPRQISDSGFGAYEVSLAAWDDGLAVAWYDTRDGNAEVYVRRLDADGRDVGPELRLTNTEAQSYEADIAALPDAFAIAWYEKARDGTMRAQLGVWRRDGTPVWSTPVAVGLGSSRNAIVRRHGDELFCAWIETDEQGAEFVWGGWWNLSGQPLGAPVRLGAAGDTTWNLNAAIAPTGEAWVVFDARAETRVEELFVATLAKFHATLARITADDGIRSKYPDLAFSADGRAALTWFDERDGNREVYLATARSDELTRPIEERARRVTTTAGASIGAYLAWNGASIGLAWCDDSSDNYEVFFQSFDAAGHSSAPPRQLSDTSTNSMVPAIEPWGDGFAMAWDEVNLPPSGVHSEDMRAEIVFTTVR
ncbi:MAG TPA: hypothetical protein VGL98_11285 [Gammaproteobacteria bacterium]